MWQWWYIKGWQATARGLLELLKRQIEGFSVPVLLRTLFAPWKQTINIPGPNTPIKVRFQWWVGNQVSRFIGFLIRAITLFVALCAVIVSGLVGVALLLSWYALPLLSVVLLVFGLVDIWR